MARPSGASPAACRTLCSDRACQTSGWKGLIWLNQLVFIQVLLIQDSFCSSAWGQSSSPDGQPPQPCPASFSRHAFRRTRWQDSVFRHLELEIQNASLQFQDSTGALGHGCLSMGPLDAESDNLKQIKKSLRVEQKKGLI